MQHLIFNRVILLALCLTLSLNAFAQSGGSNSPAPNQPAGLKTTAAVRVGLAGVKAGKVGEGVNAQELAAATQNLLGEYLKGSRVEIVPLGVQAGQSVEAEAQSKDCAYVLEVTVSHKKGSGFGKMFAQVAPMVLMVVPVVGVAGMIAGSMATTAVSAAAASTNVKPKDEITLDVKLQNGANIALSKQYKGKVKSGGEDVITPLIEQSAQAIIDAAK